MLNWSHRKLPSSFTDPDHFRSGSVFPTLIWAIRKYRYEMWQCKNQVLLTLRRFGRHFTANCQFRGMVPAKCGNRPQSSFHDLPRSKSKLESEFWQTPPADLRSLFYYFTSMDSLHCPKTHEKFPSSFVNGEVISSDRRKLFKNFLSQNYL
jgi:hypothetical protein